MVFRLPQPVFQLPEGASGGGAAPSAPASTPSSAPAATTPSSAPTLTPETSSTTPEADAGADFDFMFSSSNEDPLDGQPTAAPTVEPKPAQTPPAEVPKPAAQPEVKPAAPSPAPAQTETTSPQPAAQPSVTLDPSDPGALAQHLIDNEAQAIQHVADSLFKLSPEDVEALESDVVGTVPKLLARVLVASQRNFLLQMRDLVPQMIERHGRVSKAHGEAVGEFYTRWTDIGKVKDTSIQVGDKNVRVSDLVTQYAVVYRQMHPQASRQDVIEAVGPMVMMAAKIAPGVTVSGAQPVAQPSPMSASAGRPPQPSPFVPAGPSAGGASSVTAPQLSPVEAMFAGGDE